MTKAMVSRLTRDENERTMQSGVGPLRSKDRIGLRRGKAKPYDRNADRKEENGSGNLTTGANTPIIHPSTLANPREDFSLMELDDYNNVFSPIAPTVLLPNDSGSTPGVTNTLASASKSISASSSTSTSTTKPVEDTSSKSKDK
ncbi:hypothetical protein AGABI1DRAFT_95487 [Agaricus bisporus var. burnettii JB137-S8]|nr:uncharacterized protein AGABI1DRAFT_95487 [Agaricus bisporus var. burnettii JB137-S8]EKM74625.1 hypothetical protein AGABI1DRAFT_95487 [Agaricus bisporus var. burnettii JB137-S8]